MKLLSGPQIVGRGIVSLENGVSYEAITPNGVDLTVGAIGQVQNFGGVTLGKKDSVLAAASRAFSHVQENGCTSLNPGFYPLKLREKVRLSNSCVGFAWPRSSLIRVGNTVASGVFDAGYSGVPTVLLIVNTPLEICVGDRVVQFVVFENEGELGSYNGSYQHEGIK